jgi:hypothetical protein
MAFGIQNCSYWKAWPDDSTLEWQARDKYYTFAMTHERILLKIVVLTSLIGVGA